MRTIALVQKETSRHSEIVRELTDIGVERVIVLSLEAFLRRDGGMEVDGILLDRGESLGTFFQIVQSVGGGPPVPIVLLMEKRDEQGRDCLTGVMLQPFCDLRFASLLKEAVFHIRDFCNVCEENQKLKDEIFERKIVERAKWILVKQEGLTEDRAYRRIRADSMKNRQSMKDVALGILKRSGDFGGDLLFREPDGKVAVLSENGPHKTGESG
ncbi:MAG: ANTAR domain-containing protein [Nitrospirota bacterium]|nr:ANTAR domain-containing protein [Nitrospirota bacterium]